MNSHERLYKIVQKVFNAGQKFAWDTEVANVEGTDHPAAYPVITPLIEELLKYIEPFADDKDRLDWLELQTNGDNWCARQSTTGRGFRLHNSATRTDYPTARAAIDNARLPVGIPSSPFRSVEIENGEIK